MKHALFTASYSSDAIWYRYSLMSMKKFCHGFMPPMVCVSKKDEAKFQTIVSDVYPEAQVKVLNGSGVPRAQVAMMRIDEMCPDADILWLMGSDCIVADAFTPDPFFSPDGKPVMLYNTYADLSRDHPAVLNWKTGTERILGFKTPNETMRRVPTLAYPRLYKAVREHVEKLHGKSFDQFIIDNHKVNKDTSETNIIGSYAWEFQRDDYHWVNMDGAYQSTIKAWPNPVIQMWSHGGIDLKCDQKLDYPGGNTYGKTPRSIITEVLAKPAPDDEHAKKLKESHSKIVVLSENLPPYAEEQLRGSTSLIDLGEDDAPSEEKLFPPRMICALGVSHKDVDLAVGWLNWTSYLATLEEGTCMNYTLVIAGTQRLDAADWKRLRDAIISGVHMFQIEGMVLPDENEKGYPISASHLFLRTLEHCEQNHSGSPVLWVESDTVPMRPGWFSEIAAEYETCGKPFMGYLEDVTTIKHMPGVAVYPPNWRALSPLLANVLAAPDDKVWGSGKGRAFDIWASPETVPQMAVAKTIQQIWRPKPFTEGALGLIKEETALFHQCKTGRLIDVLARARYPDYLGRLVAQPAIPEEKPSKLFCVPGHLYKVVIGSHRFDVERRVKRFMGGFGSIIKPTSMRDQRTLEAIALSGKVEEITEETLAQEMRKLLPKKGQMKHV